MLNASGGATVQVVSWSLFLDKESYEEWTHLIQYTPPILGEAAYVCLEWSQMPERAACVVVRRHGSPS